MSGLVSGYSGVIAPPNLATNSNFRFHQRATVANGTFIPVKALDYVADVWQIRDNSTIDYMESAHHPNGWVSFKGYGKKGQFVELNNRDNSGLAHGAFYDGSKYLQTRTSWVTMYNKAGVNIKVASSPIHNGTVSTELQETTVIKPNERKLGGVCIRTGACHGEPSIGNRNRAIIYLEEDGEYWFYIYSYNMVVGAFKNPPKYAPVPYADDLARCQRYYQKGYSHGNCTPLVQSGGELRTDTSVDLKIDMAATPTISVSSLYGALWQSGDAGTGLSAGDIVTPAWYTTVIRSAADAFTVSAKRTSVIADRGVAIWEFSWTAEVV